MKSKILSILQETRPESDFDQSENFIADGLLDSFDMIVLIGELEEQFEISVDGTQIVPENFVSLEAIESLVKDALQNP
jgi:acyl carrier protein